MLITPTAPHPDLSSKLSADQVCIKHHCSFCLQHCLYVSMSFQIYTPISALMLLSTISLYADFGDSYLLSKSLLYGENAMNDIFFPVSLLACPVIWEQYLPIYFLLIHKLSYAFFYYSDYRLSPNKVFVLSNPVNTYIYLPTMQELSLISTYSCYFVNHLKYLVCKQNSFVN